MKKSEIISYGLKTGLKMYDINLILEKQLSLSKERLFLVEEVENWEEIISIIDKVSSWYPIEYALNQANFYWLDFYVDNRCLIPRNDTEIMIDVAIKNKFDVLIDIWSWSSAISISILKNIDFKPISFAVDISDWALDVSKINAKKYWVETKYINSSLLDYFLKGENVLPKNSDVLITANLPYIKDNDFENMDESVIEFEPDLALYWWKETGFELYEELINEVFLLKEKYNLISVTLLIEIWFDQKDVSGRFLSSKWIKFEYFEDNSKIPRCIKIDFN